VASAGLSGAVGGHAASLGGGGHPRLSQTCRAGPSGVGRDGETEGMNAQSRPDPPHATDGGLCLPRVPLRAAPQPHPRKGCARHRAQESGARPRATAQKDLHQTARPDGAAGMCAAGASGGAGGGQLRSPHHGQPGLAGLATLHQGRLATLPALSQERPWVWMEALSKACPVRQRHHLQGQQGDQGRASPCAGQGMKTVGAP